MDSLPDLAETLHGVLQDNDRDPRVIEEDGLEVLGRYAFSPSTSSTAVTLGFERESRISARWLAGREKASSSIRLCLIRRFVAARFDSSVS